MFSGRLNTGVPSAGCLYAQAYSAAFDMAELWRVNTSSLPASFLLRDPHGAHPDVPLHAGRNRLRHEAGKGWRHVADGEAPVIDIQIDAIRGLWLSVCEGNGGLHVNGRLVRRLMRVCPGDSLYYGQSEVWLGCLESRHAHTLPALPEEGRRQPLPAPLLRGLCGSQHGQAFTLLPSRRIGTEGVLPESGRQAADIAEIYQAEGAVWLRMCNAGQLCRVNAEMLSQARLEPGDQIVFAPSQRYLVEASVPAPLESEPQEQAAASPVSPPEPPVESARSALWLVLAALGMAALLAGLLLFGVR